MGIDPVTATIGAAVLGAVVSTAQGQQQAKAASKAADESRSASEKLYNQQQEQNNKANAKGPNVGALLAQNSLEAQSGQASTLLTGPAGVDPNSLSLGKNTLIGGS